MNTQKSKDKGEKAKSNVSGTGLMGHGMSEMMKCCTGQGGFPDCLTVMKEMKKPCCTPHKDAAEPERTGK